MSFIDEAAHEINVKIVWYSATPSTAAALVRLIGARTRPDLRHEQRLVAGDGVIVTHLHFVPAASSKLRGYATRFHLYAVESESGAVESDEVRLLLYRGADACAFIGGPGEAAALARVDAVFAAQGYNNIPIVFGAPTSDAVARGTVLGFPEPDAFVIDPTSGAGVFEAFKLLAKKILYSLAGHATTSRPTPAAGTSPLVVVPSAPRAAPTLEEAQAGLDEWQRGYHAKAIWVLGYEEARMTPDDAPPYVPPHCVHVIRRTTGPGYAVMSNGFARDPISRLELRADTARHGWQIATTVSVLGRLAHREATAGTPWGPYHVVTTAEEPVFGIKHFVLAPAGSVHVGEGLVTILRAIPITPDEHQHVRSWQLAGDRMAAWLGEREATLLDRWLPALERDRPFG